ncbi:hypothetical protein GLIP_0735 [Aliiglaciecola lipolytica E3]|uniref:Uncharacterized protein n=1 Tax=Aliiglaciecola lipolytica E3 TaxID=1127673 RepID=K6XNZ2_9ALTE|nr:hypothetical protein GLIP_0735 [Aliiglaciecola lipolytica E3]
MSTRLDISKKEVKQQFLHLIAKGNKKKTSIKYLSLIK